MLMLDSPRRKLVEVNLEGNRVALMGLIALAALVALGTYHNVVAAYEMNADGIYPLAIAKSLLIRRSTSGWMIPPAGGVVPDVLLSVVGLLLGLDGYSNIMFVFAGFVVLLSVSSVFLLRCAGCKSGTAVFAGLLSVAVLLFLGPTTSALSVLLVAPDHHQSAIAVTAAGLGLQILIATTASERQRRILAVSLATTIAVGVFSDAIVLAQLAAPVLAFAGLDLVRGSRRAACHSIMSVMVGALVGCVTSRSLEVLAGVRHGTMGVNLQWAHVVTSWRGFVSGSLQVLAKAGWGRATLALVAMLVVSALVLCNIRRRESGEDERRRAFLLLILMSTVASVSAPMLAGMWLTPAHFRYQLPLFYLPSLALVGIAVEFALSRLSGRFRFGAIAMGTVLTAMWALQSPVRGRGFLARHEELFEALRGRGLTAVVAEYWDAKPLAIASELTLPVCQVDKGARVYPWLVDLTWCAEILASLKEANTLVAVVGRYFEPLDVVDILGPPLWSETLAGFQVWYYPGPRLRRRLLKTGCARFREFSGLKEIAKC